MKKNIFLTLILSFILVLAACGKEETKEKGEVTNQKVEVKKKTKNEDSLRMLTNHFMGYYLGRTAKVYPVIDTSSIDKKFQKLLLDKNKVPFATKKELYEFTFKNQNGEMKNGVQFTYKNGEKEITLIAYDMDENTFLNYGGKVFKKEGTVPAFKEGQGKPSNNELKTSLYDNGLYVTDYIVKSESKIAHERYEMDEKTNKITFSVNGDISIIFAQYNGIYYQMNYTASSITILDAEKLFVETIQQNK
jgi:hypothetical protein